MIALGRAVRGLSMRARTALTPFAVGRRLGVRGARWDRNPGARLEEIPSGPRPIEAVGTSVAAFVGLAQGGPLAPSYVDSWRSYTQQWSGRSPLGDAVEEFFRNGGSLAWVAPVESLEPEPSDARSRGLIGTSLWWPSSPIRPRRPP